MMQTHRCRILFTGSALLHAVYMLRVALNLFTVCTWVCTRVCVFTALWSLQPVEVNQVRAASINRSTFPPSASRRDRRKAARKFAHTSLIKFGQFPSVSCCCCCSCCVIYCDDCGLCHWPSLSSASSVHVRKLSQFLTSLALTFWHFSPLPPSLHPPPLLSFSRPRYLEEDESAKGKRTKWAEHDEMFALLLIDATLFVKEGTK